LAGKKSYLHWGDPSKTPKALKEHNVSVVSLANNHTLDYGMTGLRQSLKALEQQAIQWLGAGRDEVSAVQPLRFDYLLAGRPFRIVIAAGFEYHEKYDKAYNFYADGDKGGTNAWTLERATEQMRTIRHADPHAFVVAYPHFGKNYAWKTHKQTRLARALIDAGADLVIGHGAHMLQEIEQYRGHWIIYNLGNFVFNSPGRYQKKKIDPFSLVARLNVMEKQDAMTFSLRLYPIFSDNRITNYQPHFVTDQQFHRVQKLLLHHSINKRQLQNEMGGGRR
jgi:poly-gamma-glutamate capsule biosynthesis protein CapA/YwtB (metallophosphatase superfamily)